MREVNPLILLGVGFALLILGWVLPVLMIMQILKSTFFLNFVSYLASFMGLMLGVIGSVLFLTRSRRR